MPGFVLEMKCTNVCMCVNGWIPGVGVCVFTIPRVPARYTTGDNMSRLRAVNITNILFSLLSLCVCFGIVNIPQQQQLTNVLYSTGTPCKYWQ